MSSHNPTTGDLNSNSGSSHEHQQQQHPNQPAPGPVSHQDPSQQQHQHQQLHPSQQMSDSNKRAALAGQWRTPPLPVFPTSASSNQPPPPHQQYQHHLPPPHQHQQHQHQHPGHPQSQPPPPPQSTHSLPAPTSLPDNSEDYAKALQEAYRRGAEAAAAMAAHQQHMTPSASCPNFQMPMAPAPPPPPHQVSHGQPIVTSRSEDMAASSTAYPPPHAQPHPTYHHPQYAEHPVITHHNHAPPPGAPHHPPPPTHQHHQQQHPPPHQYAPPPQPTYGAPGPTPTVTATSQPPQATTTTVPPPQQQQPTPQPASAAPAVPNPLSNMPPPPKQAPTQLMPPPPPPTTSSTATATTTTASQIVVNPPQQRSVSLPDMTSYAVQAEEEKRQKRLARNRASARLRRLRKKNLVDAYETEVGILEKTLQQLKAHEWGVPATGPGAAAAAATAEKSHQSLLEALCMDRGQQVITSEQRAQQCQDILEQQLEQMEMLRQVQFEQQLLACAAGGAGGENKEDDPELAELAQELNQVLGLTDEQKAQLQVSSKGLEEEMAALDTVFSSLVMMKENEWLLNQGVQDITDQLTSILHKNQMSKFLLWADANVEAIDQLDHVHAAPKNAPHPQGPIFTFGVETTPMDDEGDCK